MSWHDKHSGLNSNERMQKQLAYYKTFYGNEDGRKVLVDLRRYIYEFLVETPDAAVAKCMLIDLYEYIRQSSGINNELLVIERESSVPLTDKEIIEEEHENIDLQEID